MPGTAEGELQREQRYVAALYERLDELREQSIEQLELTRRGGATGSHQARSERDAMARVFEDRIRQLREVDDRLAFGRLLADDGGIRYIGRIGLRDETQQPLLLDWRAPQASAFYQATAATPLGVRVRRHLTTRGRAVTGVEDEVFDPENVPEDVLLTGESALLAALSAQRTGRMHDIVATIQAEQDRIIRSDVRGALVVQGGPGTGKTAVALHRAAYLLYAFKDRLARGGVLIVGPSQSFLQYIEQVLPSLGETGVVLRTTGQLYPSIDARADDSSAVAGLKGRTRMAEVVRRAVLARQVVPETPTEITIENERLSVDPLLILRAVRRAQQTRKPHNLARLTFVREALGQLTTQYAEHLQGRGSAIDDEDRRLLREDLRTNHDVRVLLNGAWLPLTPEKLLADLYARPAYLAAVTPGWTEAERALLARPRESPFTIADIPLLDEAAELLGEPDAAANEAERRARESQRRRDLENAERAIENMGVEGMVTAEEVADGFSDDGETMTLAERAGSDRAWTYGHIVVDEAQELTPMQWRLLRRRGPLGSFTIVGDLAQASVADPPKSWDDALSVLGLPLRREELSVNYRTPRQIAELAEHRAAQLGLPITPTRSVRDALWPVDEWAGTPIERLVVDAVLADRDIDAVGTVAVIAPEHLVAGIRAALQESLDERIGLGSEGLGARIAVMAPRTAKGLEFDTAVVVDTEGIAGLDGPGSLYVAMTRPTQRLVLIEPGDRRARR